ncbi:MAG: type II toxin-antitoxin system Phd/YefM family antitoxin [Candidatus Vogelbacteria bacterium]|nr:type II toxin-antitoxin system Phd/YefM family antitoxin [Candidatus Vogelbacteria bacterium]
MAIKFIGIKELRQNMAKISSAARKRRERLIVLRKNEPLFELRPLSDQNALIETFRRDMEEAHADVRAGRLYTQKEARQMLGL